MKKLTLENTQPFQGLPELVAYDEGLFAKEGLAVEWVDRDKGAQIKGVEYDRTSPKGGDPFESHGRMFEVGKADMYNACEWGNYCRVQDSSVQSGRQIGRRAIVTYAGLVVRPDSPVYTPQQLANRLVGVPFYFGTHYLALHMLEGFLPRDQIRICSAPNGSRYRYDSMMKGEIEATTQALQMAYGAQHANVRHSGTLATLGALGEAGVIAEDLCRELDHAYVFLRAARHRRELGLADDQQKQVDASRERARAICRELLERELRKSGG